MLADILKKDIRQLAARGVELTPDEIVRLNALAVKVERSAHAASTVHLPRLAFLPRDSRWRAPIVLREPTLAHELWIERALGYVDCRDEFNYLFLHAFALSREAALLPDATCPWKVLKAVFRFASRRLVSFTRRQLASAVGYALFGADWTQGESAAAEKAGKKPKDAPADPPSPTLGLIADGRRLRLPLTADDAERMSASELEESINRALMDEGRFDVKAARHYAMAAYVRTRNEITAAREAEASRTKGTGE